MFRNLDLALDLLNMISLYRKGNKSEIQVLSGRTPGLISGLLPMQQLLRSFSLQVDIYQYAAIVQAIRAKTAERTVTDAGIFPWSLRKKSPS